MLLSSQVPQADYSGVDPMLMEFAITPTPTMSDVVSDPQPPIPAPMSPVSAPADFTPPEIEDGSSPGMVTMETVRFEVASEPIACDSALRNVTVVRGTRTTLPLHLFSDVSEPVKEVVANFANAVCGDAPAPVLQATPPRRQTRPQQQVFSVRRSERLAKKSRRRATKPSTQAQNVMMKKMGITSDTQPPDATSFQQYTATFSSPLTLTHSEALDALLPSGMGALTVEAPALFWCLDRPLVVLVAQLVINVERKLFSMERAGSQLPIPT